MRWKSKKELLTVSLFFYHNNVITLSTFEYFTIFDNFLPELFVYELVRLGYALKRLLRRKEEVSHGQ